MSTFGQYFRVSTYGESHGKSVGCIVDGVPPGLKLTEDDIQPQMTRRRPGQSALTTPRDEKDRVEIQSGTEFGVTLGTPIGMRVMNQDQRPKDYGSSTMDMFPRPSHADWTYLEKYGVKASSGGGRSSARETIGRVAAGAIAEKYLSVAHGVEIVAFTNSVGNEYMFPPSKEHPTASTNPDFLDLIGKITRNEVDENLPIRCPNAEAGKRMETVIEESKAAQDSIGGTVTCVIRNCPSGLGEPCFDKLEATLAHAMLSIPATKGFEIGSGFGGCSVPGSKHNDAFIKAPATSDPSRPGVVRPRLTTKTNNSGGIQGGIAQGQRGETRSWCGMGRDDAEQDGGGRREKFVCAPNKRRAWLSSRTRNGRGVNMARELPILAAREWGEKSKAFWLLSCAPKDCYQKLGTELQSYIHKAVIGIILAPFCLLISPMQWNSVKLHHYLVR